MRNYKIELLFKEDNEGPILFKNKEKIVELFRLIEQFRIDLNVEEGCYKLIFNEQQFNFYISEESEYIYSIVVYIEGVNENSQDISEILDNLKNVVRLFKEIISKKLKNCSYKVLWDDPGIFYSELAFPKIIQIENLMRKLITKFMLVSVGMDFFDRIPKDINQRDDNNDSSFLHNIDFINLSQYLFKNRPLKDEDELMKIINSINDNKLPPEVNLMDYKKDSYWNRYFKEKIGADIDGDLIRKDWEHLYKLRCQVAHSKFLNKADYIQIECLCNKLTKIFSDALQKLNTIGLSEEIKENISEDIFSEIEGKFWYEKLYEIIIKNFDDEFTLNELYRFTSLLHEQYPNNNTIQSSIRRNLQKLRDMGKIEFIGNGSYKIINCSFNLE